VTGIKDYTCHDEHQVLYGSAESLNCTSENNITLYEKNKHKCKCKNSNNIIIRILYCQCEGQWLSHRYSNICWVNEWAKAQRIKKICQWQHIKKQIIIITDKVQQMLL